MTGRGGIVLCGGKSSRMGRPKALLPFGDETLVERVVRILRTAVDEIVVVAAPDQQLPVFDDRIHIVHDQECYLGPLNGLRTGLLGLAQNVDAAFVAACDTPFLSADYVRWAFQAANHAEIGWLEQGGFVHPLSAVYRRSVLPTIDRLLALQRLRPIFLGECHTIRTFHPDEVAVVDPNLGSFRNLNHPIDYETALAQLAAGEVSAKTSGTSRVAEGAGGP